MTSLCALVLVCAMSLPQVLAETLRDPTQPPADPNAGAAAGRAQVAPPRVLRSIRIAAHDQVATIGGTRVRVGDSVGQAKVVAIRSNEVVLSEASVTRTLKLYPGVQKRPRDPRPQAIPIAATTEVAPQPTP